MFVALNMCLVKSNSQEIWKKGAPSQYNVKCRYTLLLPIFGEDLFLSSVGLAHVFNFLIDKQICVVSIFTLTFYFLLFVFLLSIVCHMSEIQSLRPKMLNCAF